MEFFTATGKLKKFFFLQLEMFDVYTTGDTAHINKIFNIEHLYLSKKNFFSFLVAVKNSVKLGPLVFLL